MVRFGFDREDADAFADRGEDRRAPPPVVAARELVIAVPTVATIGLCVKNRPEGGTSITAMDTAIHGTGLGSALTGFR